MIATDNVSKSYGARAALAPTTIEFKDGRTTALIGPSGCGKSTLLRVLVGLIQPDSGRVLLDGHELKKENLQKARHGIGYVIQDGGLFPHLSAERNVTLLARFLGTPKDQREARVAELAELTQMPKEQLARYPGELSGGQRQRVSLMRALMLDPEVLLLDEPLGALDPITRYELQAQLKEIFQRLGKTVILVTHDMGEAAYFATGEIVLMRSGSVVQRGAAQELRERPAEPFVTQFIHAQRSPWENSDPAGKA